MKIGICGAGVAGPTLAHFLLRTGHDVTLIERAPGFRSGGYVIDFWGTGYDVAERMGLTEPILTRGYKVKEVRLVKADGSAGGGFPAEVFHRLTHDRFTSIARGDLAEVIYDSVKGQVETLFGDTVAAIHDDGNGVDVTLQSGGSRRFDLLVGADGLHSQVRRLVWSEGSGFERRLGFHVAAFELTGYPHRNEDVYVSYAEPGLSISRFSMRDDRTLCMLVFSDAHMPAPEPTDNAGRRALLNEIFGKSGWETQELLQALTTTSEEVYFDRVSQIEVVPWSKGRTVLLGDAGACASLLAGEGTGLAMTEAYVLAGELHRAGDDIRAALAAYEARLRPFLTQKQKTARAFASSFAPETEFGIWLRRVATEFMVIPFVADHLIGSTLSDNVEIPDYGI